MAFKITCVGGAETVTGSNFLIENATSKILIDCGVEQGKDYCDSCAHESFPYDPKEIDALVITHAHLDHIGRAPKLVRDGFRGKVYMTPPTRDLSELILRDSAHILLEESKRTNVPLLYTERDVDEFLSLIETVPYRQEKKVTETLSMFLRDTGHILGSASVRVHDMESDASFALTSDIGASPAALLPDAEPITDADVVLIESVYGNRQNTEKEHRVEQLKEILKRALQQRGAILIPAFSIERTQLMLYELSNMFAKGELPKTQVFLDSPLAIHVTEVYKKWAKDYFKKDVQSELHKEGDLFQFPFLTMTLTREESDNIRKTPNPKIIMAGAGMSHGGRIARHEMRYLPDPHSTLVMVGYQAPGSPGRVLQGGAKRVHLHGQEVAVRARVESLHGWSGHADRDGLFAFAQSCVPRTKTFLVGIGEPSSARFLAQRINNYLGVKAIVPTKGQSFSITKEGVKPL